MTSTISTVETLSFETQCTIAEAYLKETVAKTTEVLERTAETCKRLASPDATLPYIRDERRAVTNTDRDEAIKSSLDATLANLFANWGLQNFQRGKALELHPSTWNPAFPASNYRYGPHPWGGETLSQATENWMSYTNLTEEQKTDRVFLGKMFMAIQDIRKMYPKRLPIEVSIRVGELQELPIY